MDEHHDPAPIGSLERVMHRLTVGSAQAIRTKDRRDTASRPCELEQQYQFSVKGTAGTAPAWAEVDVQFTHAFYFAPADRDSTLEYPHFTFGSHSNPPQAVVATVTSWLHDERNGSIIGATVAVGAMGGGNFTGHVHLTFQGYGALIEPDEDPFVNEG